MHPNECGTLHLWDGHSYCRQCVEEHSELLVRSAIDHGPLCDTLTLRDSILWWQFPLCCVIAFGLLLVITFVFMRAIFVEALLLSGFFGTVMFPIYLATTGMQRPQTIAIVDGKVFYKTPLLKRVYALSECTWELDGRMEDSAWYPLSRLLSKTDAIVLHAGSGLNRLTAFCCVDNESRELWSAFLAFAARQRTAEVVGPISPAANSEE